MADDMNDTFIERTVAPWVPQPPPDRPSLPPAKAGLRVSMSRIQGLTKPDLLRTPFLFQCAPSESLSRSLAFAHSDYDTLNAGQHSRPLGMQLRSITFSTLLVDYGAPFTLIDPLPTSYQGVGDQPDGADDPRFASNAPNPLEMADELEAILASGTPFYLHIGQRELWDRMDVEGMPATLRSIEIEERAGEPDARYLNSVSFVEFRHPTLLTRQSSGTTGTRKGKAGKSALLPTSVVVKNLPANRNTLYELAKFFYGSAAKWREIAKANGLTNVPPGLQLPVYFGPKSSRKLTIPALR